MAIFAAWLGAALASVVGWFAAWATKQVAIRLAIISMFLALTVGLWTALSALMAGVVMAVPSALTIPASWLWPTNANACAAAYISARVLLWAYHADLWALKLRAI